MTLDYEPAQAIAAIGRADKHMAKLIRRVGPLDLQPSKIDNTFQTLVRAIIYQQLSGKAAATIHGRAVDAFGTRKKIAPERLLAAKDEALRAVGLSRAKVAAVRDLAAKTLDGTVPTVARLRKMSDEEIVVAADQCARHWRVDRRNAAVVSSRAAGCLADLGPGSSQRLHDHLRA